MPTLKQFKPDEKMTTEGIKVPFGETDPDTGDQAYFIVSYSGNDAYRNKVSELTRRAHRQMPGRDIPAKAFANLQREAMIGTVLLDWYGLYEPGPDGKEDKTKPLPFTKENAAMVLGTPILFGLINEAAANLSNFQEEQEAADKAAVKSGGPLESKVE